MMTEVEEGKHCKNTHILGVDADDLMVQNLSKNVNFLVQASGKTDSSGRFELVGSTHEFTTIDPKLV